MSTIKVMGHLYVERLKFALHGRKEGDFVFSLLPYRSENTRCWGAYLGPVEFDYTMPEGLDIEAETVRQQIAELEREKAEAGREYARKVAAINEQLSKLQAITCEGTP